MSNLAVKALVRLLIPLDEAASNFSFDAVGKINGDTVDSPRFVAFEGASRENCFSSFNPGQLTKRIHRESNEFDEAEAYKPSAKINDGKCLFF